MYQRLPETKRSAPSPWCDDAYQRLFNREIPFTAKSINTYVAGYGCLVMMKSSTPNNDKTKEIDPMIRCSRLEKASSKMPNSIVKITNEKIISLKIIVSCESCHKETNAIWFPCAWPKIGRTINKPTMQSEIPKSKCWKFFRCCCCSFSAIDSNSLLDSNSSIEISKTCEIAFKESILGNPRPDSHLETAVREINSLSANSSCVHCLF